MIPSEDGPVTIEGNAICCDGYGSHFQDTFVGDLSSEDIRLRYNILGWQISDTDGQEIHFCPDHT